MKRMLATMLIIGLGLAVNSTIAQDIALPTNHGPDRTNPWNETNFITPLGLRLTVPEHDRSRRVTCRGVKPSECPKMLIWGGNRKGGLPTLDPVLTADLPSHVRVTFVLQRFQLTGVVAHLDVWDVTIWDPSWKTHSSVADQELGEFALKGKIDEEFVDSDGYFFTPPVIYDALVLNACDDFSSFSVSHEADFDTDDSGSPAIPFTGFDDSTIDSTGFYEFSYTVPVDDAEDKPGPPYESGLHMSGKISVLCTSADKL